MKRSLLILFASVFLLFNAFGALYGGWNLITYPDGSSMQMSPDLLKSTPFHNYLIPGIILFTANGLLSLGVVVALWLKFRASDFLVMGQGAILTGWILIQVLFIRIVIPLHFIMGAVGLALFFTGWALLKTNPE